MDGRNDNKTVCMQERKKVLIADDEIDVCLLMKTFFLRKNYEVYLAHTFDDAIEKVVSIKPDLVHLNSALCSHPEEQIKKLKEAVPDAEIIINKQTRKNDS